MELSSIPTPSITPSPGDASRSGSAVASTSISIEKAKASDAPAMSVIGSKTFTEAFSHMMPGEDLAVFLAATYSAEVILAEFPDPSKTTLVARDSTGRLVGMVQFVRGKIDPSVEGTPAELTAIEKFYVDPSVHGQGIGTKLAIFVEEMARQEGFKKLWLTVSNENGKAHRLYERLGYVRTDGDASFTVGATVMFGYVFVKQL